jgi:ATP-binding cassette subfamily B (MDR/TAP) protein 1
MDIRTLNVMWLRERMGLVSQEPVLFPVSVGENIAYGRGEGANVSQEEIEEAAKAASAHNFITKLPSGYNTNVGDRGSQLSGGQKQRIAIARAIIRRAAIQIFDEATSALDSSSEAKVTEAIDRLLNSSIANSFTSLTIAHRLSTIQKFHIIVLQKGRIVEQGDHDSLMKSETGLYRQLREAQSLIGDQDKKTLAESASSAAMIASLGTTAASFFAGSTAVAIPEATAVDDIPVDSKVAEVEANEKNETAKKPGCCSRKKKETVPKAKADGDELPSVPSKEIWAYQKPEIIPTIFAVFFAGLSGAVMPIFSIVFARMVASFYNPDTENVKKDTHFYMGMFFMIGCVALVANLGMSSLFAFVGEKLTRRLRVAVYRSLLRQPVGFFDLEKNSTGRLTSKLCEDAALIKATTGDALGRAVQAVCAMIAAMIIAFTSSWALTLVVLGVFPLIAIVGASQVKMMSGFSTGKGFEESGNVAVQAVGSIRTVHAFGLQKMILANFHRALAKPTSGTVRRSMLTGLFMGISMGVLFWSYAFVFWVGAKLIEKGQINFQEVLNTFFAIVMAGQGIGQASALAVDKGKAEKATRSVFSIIKATSTIDPLAPKPAALPMDPTAPRGRIEFKNVTFAYPTRPKNPALKNFSMVIEAGTHVSLVGPSGSGKSSIVQLLERFYDPQEGVIEIDGVDIRTMHPHDLRDRLALVSQEPALWADSVQYNIAYGSRGEKPVPDAGVPIDAGPGARVPSSFALQPEVEMAARDANAHGFVTEFLHGYATHVGERGGQLSGGQKQRVAIARAILRNAPIIAFDEAVAALDEQSAQVVSEAIDRLIETKGATTKISIAHRLATIRKADKIVVVRDGAFVEEGTHDTLFAQDGVYRQLVLAQDGRAEAGAAISIGVVSNT